MGMGVDNSSGVTSLQVEGYSKKVGTPTVTVIQWDSSGNVTRAQGTTVPTDADAGYAKGCLFVDTDASLGSILFLNEGTATSCDFNVVESGASSITGVTAGNGLTGGGTSGTVTLAVDDNIAFAKEVNHALSVATTTTAATAGGNMAVSAGTGATSGAGGDASLTGGVGGVSGAGGKAKLVAGAAGTGSANAAGGQAEVTGGAGQGTSAGGAVVLTSGASENGTAVSPGASGAIQLTVGAAGTATTGTGGAGGAVSVTGAAGGASTGAASTAGAGSDVTIAAGAGGASSGGSDTGGRGGNVAINAGAAGSGTTAGLAGVIFARSPLSRKSISTTATDTATLSMAQILSGVVRCTPTAAASYTMPTGAVIAAALPTAFTTGDCLDFHLVNVATNDTFDITLVTAASGTTLFGNLIVEANSAAAKWASGCFRIECTGAATYNVIRLG